MGRGGIREHLALAFQWTDVLLICSAGRPVCRAKQFEELFRHQFAEVGPAELLGPEYITKGELLYKVRRTGGSTW